MLQNNIRTTLARRMSFEDALDLQPMILPVVKLFMEQRVLPQAKGRAVLAKNVPVLVELWDGLCGVQDYDGLRTCMAQCVDFTIPPEFVPVVRRSAAITTAFAFCEHVKQLLHVRDLDDDLEERAAMVRGWAEFEKRRQEANQVKEGFGCDESQSWQTLRDITDDKSKDPQLLTKITKIAELAGRMYEHFGYHRKDQKNDDPQEATGAKTGGDIERLLPTEIALLGDEDTADHQAMKILQDNAAIMQMEGVESKFRGPLVLVVDESGSMHDGQNGWNGTRAFAGRNTWAKACCVALTRIAWSEDRAVVCVHFGNGTVVQPVPKDDYRAMFEMARHFLSGGTNFGSALSQGIREVGDLEKAGKEGADILLISDGEEPDWGTHNRQIDRMDAQGIQLWTVAIGDDFDPEAPVRKRAQRYTYATDRQLGDPNTATELAHGLDQAAKGNDPTLN